MENTRTRGFVDQVWESSILPALIDYIRIPNKSPLFDPEWQAHGHMDRALDRIVSWSQSQPVPEMKLEVMRLPGRTPLLFIDIPGDSKDCVLLYGHYDKQPEMTGWREGLGPWTPVVEDEKLYGRGGADDGYAVFASLTAMAALKEQRVK